MRSRSWATTASPGRAMRRPGQLLAPVSGPAASPGRAGHRRAVAAAPPRGSVRCARNASAMVGDESRTLLASANHVPALAKSRTRAAPRHGGSGHFRPPPGPCRARLLCSSSANASRKLPIAPSPSSPMRPERRSSPARLGDHALGALNPGLQRTHLLVLRRQGQQHQRLAAGLGQRFTPLQRPHQQRIGLLQPLAARCRPSRVWRSSGSSCWTASHNGMAASASS